MHPAEPQWSLKANLNKNGVIMSKIHGHIASHMGHRTRIRIIPAHRNPEDMQTFADAIRKLPSVDSVNVNVSTGSIMIEHRGADHDHFRGVLKDVGCILRSAFSLGLPAGVKAGNEFDIAQAIADLDLRTGLMHTPFGLSNLIPVALAAVALIQMHRQGIQITSAPWYIPAYLAWYTYTRLRPMTREINSVTE